MTIKGSSCCGKVDRSASRPGCAASAALAHVARLPVLLLPGDVFVSRLPDPVLQQVESFEQGDLSA
ncbi:hypothetical protein, partial [Sphaerotilus sulfidivorans]|uniref:hypothetical protein n=1 Tax=Sphaerotilus sulfidivorans TaxID=639200 RepID=UPI0015DACEDF